MAKGGERNRYDAITRLLSCTDPNTLLHTLVHAGLADIGARAGAVYLVQDDGWLRLAAALGVEPHLLTDRRLLPPDHDLPIARVVRTRQPVYAPTEAHHQAFPSVVKMDSGNVSFVAVPLLADDRCLGSIFIGLDRPWAFDETDRAALATMTAVCAHRLEYLLSHTRPGGPGGSRAIWMLDAQARAARLELAMSAAGTGAFDWELHSNTLIWDERLCRIFGLEPAAFDERAETFMNAIHPDDRQLVRKSQAAAIAARGDYRAVYRIVRPDREVRWVDAKGRVVSDALGHPVRMVGVAHDCTEQQRREEREQAAKDAQRARERLIMQVTRALSQASTVDEVVSVMTGTALPALSADALVVHLDDGGLLRLAGAAGYGEAARERLRTLDRGVRSPMSRALAAGTPLFFEQPDAYAAAFPDPPHHQEPGQRAWAVLPLTAADRTVGTCQIAFSRPHRFSADDRTLYTALAGILAQSLERARLFDQERRRMTELQRVMLPRRLPELPGLAVAARYLPGSEGMEVGGDWYDVLPLPDGRVGLVIGDVQGHSTRAAAVMGQLRIALRAYAAEGHDPATLMSRTNRLLCGMDTDLFATCCCVELDPLDGTAHVVRAGHPHPLLLGADGRAGELEVPGGLPLGLDPAEEYPVSRIVLPPGALLLLHTDGLVESRDQEYGAAVAELAGLLQRWAASAGADDAAGLPDRRHGVQRLADRVAGPAAARSAREDDIALLLVLRTPDPDAAPPLAADWRIAAGDLRGLADARRGLRRRLVEWGLYSIAGDAELLAAELLSNAVLHAGGDVELTARLDGDVLRVEVLDSSRHRPRLMPGDHHALGEPGEPAAEGGGAVEGWVEDGRVPVSGRGVRLVDAFAERWGWEPLGDRKAVWFELRADKG
ncbi:SpoIIE family protein phosphatase [Streptomyces sp. NPDC092296]|uniref:SpoIIE family protein phosphatase n=1 Tax=Streptomyces sp. NPDC092296 TaxID=3366012 RepID=UPI003818CBA1